MKQTPVSVIILTYNEEANIRSCLESVQSLTKEVFVVDSFSTDKTLEIAREYTQKIFQNPWTHYAGQRQWALANLPFTNDWILFLDADERLTPPLKRELSQVIIQEIKKPFYGGYYIPRHFFFLGKRLRFGGCQDGLKEMRLCNRHNLIIEERAGHEVYISTKAVGSLREPIIHEDKKPLSAWIDRHNRYASANAKYLTYQDQGNKLMDRLGKHTDDYRLYWKEKFRRNFWNKLPILFRPTLLFCYRYFIKLGFLDGLTGFIYIFLHDFWLFLLMDAMYLEIRRKLKNNIS
jgi:glycosyltransferase involved in cell wall biosynthesis